MISKQLYWMNNKVMNLINRSDDKIIVIKKKQYNKNNIVRVTTTSAAEQPNISVCDKLYASCEHNVESTLVLSQVKFSGTGLEVC